MCALVDQQRVAVGAALATISLPRMPLAPPLLSMMTVCFQRSARRGTIRRATRSVPPPAGVGHHHADLLGRETPARAPPPAPNQSAVPCGHDQPASRHACHAILPFHFLDEQTRVSSGGNQDVRSGHQGRGNPRRLGRQADARRPRREQTARLPRSGRSSAPPGRR